MPKILVVEDSIFACLEIRRVLSDMCEVHFVVEPNKEMLSYGVQTHRLPPIEAVAGIIASTNPDVILLDNRLDDAGYHGWQLLQYCNREKVIGISDDKNPDIITCWTRKAYLDRPEVAEELRQLVKQVAGAV
jgi:CheY-like chemotaxis protein